ncbi:hypothetical protein DL546_005363 [Coniochaeta pulveracea]|uniref:Mid2 domain-containing protein n=1 Tax=Coniochaeta pulveracea TaxID=177199 RepID=A0A420Y4E6_9PEZI|nr:hypothetical protein DL546_005363 [Coniochaeta pulveracea]
MSAALPPVGHNRRPPLAAKTRHHAIRKSRPTRMLKPRKPVCLATLRAASMIASVTASTIPMNNLFESGGTCAAGFSYCQKGQPAFPSNFCCETTETCIPLAASTTMMCCPAGTDCTIIAPISCNLTLQDPNYDPKAFIKTTALHGTLGHCGDGTCCPYGFSCGEDPDHGITCKMDKDQNHQPTESVPISSTTSPTASSGSRSSSTITPSTPSGTSIQVIPTSSPSSLSSSSSSLRSTSTGGTTPVSTTDPDTTPSSNPDTNTGGGGGGTPTAVIAGAAVGAVLVTIAVAFIAWVFLKRSRSRKHAGDDDDRDALKLTRSTSSFGNIISNPIISETTKPMRSDFVRKSPGRSSMVGSILGSFGRSPTLVPETPSPPRSAGTTTTVAGARVPPIRGMAQARQSSIAYGFGAPNTSPYANDPPRTPPNQREPSSISINVFADPRTVGTPPERTRSDNRQTTFSDMLRSADLGGVARGEPYVPPTPRPGLPSSPRPRPRQGGTGTPGSRLR